jgi:Replication-relaxation
MGAGLVSRDGVLAVQASLTARDIVLLSWLYDHGVLTTPQISRALFTSTTFTQRRLQRLLSLRLLARFRPQRPDGGSFPYHYVLDQLGVEVIAAQRGDPLPRPGQARARWMHLTARANLVHLCGVNGFFTDLAAHARLDAGFSLDRWWPAARFQKPGAFYQHGDSPDVSLITVRLRPDGHGVVTNHVHDQARSVPFFLEYDTGTEALPVLLDKIDRYNTLWTRTGRFWPVLFHLPTTARELHLHQRIGERWNPGIPVVTCAADHLVATGLSPAEQVWWLYGRPGTRLTLADLPNGDYQHVDQGLGW